jgi:AcrR family transcriptional regulator
MSRAPKRAYKMVARAQATEQTRRQIIEAAMTLFGQRPFDLVSLADVARASGLGLATVVRQFETKQHLFAAAVADARRVLEAQVDAMPENDPAAAVRQGIDGYERFGDAIVRILAQEDRLPMVRKVIEHGRNEHTRWVNLAFSGVLTRPHTRRRKVRLAQLMAATDVLFWKVLRRDLGLSRRETEQAVTEIVEGLCR